MIVGIDPGSRYCGYGLLQVENRKVVAAGCDVIELIKEPDFPARLVKLYSRICEILDEYRPEIAAVESMFFHKHIKSVFTLGHARGVIFLALAQRQIPVVEYSPREVKKAVVGVGNATKMQVRYMMQQIYELKSGAKTDDAFDALAVATTHYHRTKWNKK